jgi:hypothetical protein
MIQPYDTSDGLEDLDWKDHPCSDSYLMKMANIFEVRSQRNADLFLGHGLPDKPHVGQEFIHNLGGYPKPVVSGSDALSIDKYGVYPSGRITWLKAQPTFITQNPTKYMTRLQIKKAEGSSLSDYWFHGTDIPLNPGLIAVIGNKGTGKSALADILALAGNTHSTDLEFLNAKRFRKGNNIARQFATKLTWADGSHAIVKLDQEIDLDRPERVPALPRRAPESPHRYSSLPECLSGFDRNPIKPTDKSRSNLNAGLRSVSFLLVVEPKLLVVGHKLIQSLTQRLLLIAFRLQIAFRLPR